MNRRTFNGFFLVMLVAVRAQELAPNAPKDKPVGATAATLSDYEKAIAPYIKEAKKTYPEAKKRFLAGLPAKHYFYVTTRIKDPDGKFEQVFIYVTSLDEEKKSITGRISNPLAVVRTFKPGQTISFAETEIIDWTIARPDGSEEGNYVGKFLDEYQKKKKS